MNLKDKIMLVTGGSSGIGYAIAEKAKGKGATVIILARDRKKLDSAAKKLDAVPIVCDVSDEKQVMEAYKTIVEEFGKLDILVNNAGYGYFDHLENLDADKFIELFKTNTLGPALMAKHASKMFKFQNSGNIVNISSTAGTKGFPAGTPYVATKFALKGMTECWRAELRKHNIRVILVNPSEVQTSFNENAALGKKNYDPTKLISDDIAHAVISALEMEDRGFITELTVFATNPRD